MSTYAKVVGGKVVQVIMGDDGFLEHFVDTTPGAWILCDEAVGMGFDYDPKTNTFIPPKPYPSWIYQEGRWQAPIPAPQEVMACWNEALGIWEEPLQAAKSFAKQQVDTFAKEARIKVAGTSDAIEVAAWNNKLRIAKAVLEGSATPDEIKSIEAEIVMRDRQESATELRQKIIQYADLYAVAVASIDGMQKRAYQDIEACSDALSIHGVLDQLLVSAKALLQRLSS